MFFLFFAVEPLTQTKLNLVGRSQKERVFSRGKEVMADNVRNYSLLGNNVKPLKHYRTKKNLQFSFEIIRVF